MELKQVRVRLDLILGDHYGVGGRNYRELLLQDTVRDVDMDSLALLEFFLVIEEGFGLEGARLSSRIDVNTALDLSMKEFVDIIAVEVLKIYRGVVAS